MHTLVQKGALTMAMAITALVLGIVGVLNSFFPCTCWIFGYPCGILAVIFGILGLKKAKTTGKGKGLALTGLILGATAFLFSTIWTVLTIVAANDTPSYYSRSSSSYYDYY